MNARRALIAGLAAVPLLALLAFGLTRDPREIPSPLPGREAPDFALAVFERGGGLDSASVPDTLALSRMRGKVVVLNFFASWCLACRDEHSTLAQTAAAYYGKPVQFMGVLYNDKPENGREWIRMMGGVTYPAVLDPGSRTAINFGLYGVPETFFIAPNGRVAYKHTGPVTPAVLMKQIDALLPEAGAGSVAPPAGDTAERAVVRR